MSTLSQNFDNIDIDKASQGNDNWNFLRLAL